MIKKGALSQQNQDFLRDSRLLSRHNARIDHEITMMPDNPKPEAPKLSFLACHLLGQITKGCPAYPTVVQFRFSQDEISAAMAAELPNSLDLLEEIESFKVIEETPDLRRRFRVIEFWEFDEDAEIISVALSREYLAWPKRMAYVELFENASTKKTTH